MPQSPTPTPPLTPEQVRARQDGHAREVARLAERLERATWTNAPTPNLQQDFWGTLPPATYGRAPERAPAKAYCTPPCRRNCKCGRMKAKP